MASVGIHGYTFEYCENGSGTPIMFVHGSASDSRTWSCQQNRFSSYYRTIAYSRRYHWPNERIQDEADYSMSEQVNDLEALLRALDAVPAHLVGHSYGAFLCLLLAIRAPTLVRTLVLAEPPIVSMFVSNPPRPSEILGLVMTRPRTAASIVKFGATGVTPATQAARHNDVEGAMLTFGKAVLGPTAFGQLSQERISQVRANSIKSEFLGSGFAPLKDDQVRSVQTPTLLVTGERSPALFHRLTDRLEELMPDTERVKIRGASHIMHEDNPPAYSRAVLSFLARYDKAGHVLAALQRA